MAIHRKTQGALTIPGPCFICGKLIGVNQNEDLIFWHGVTGGQQPFIRLHPQCAHALAAGLNEDLRRLASDEAEEAEE
jgi:hypothetical protein